MFDLWKHWKRKKIISRPFPAAWENLLRQQWPLYARLPETLRDKLHRRIQIFVAEKNFEGLQGLSITDEIRVLIAAQACLLLLGDDRADFRDLQSILVYPGEFDSASTEILEGGVVHEGVESVHGESWDFGTVTLSWPSVQRGARHEDDGFNVVIHEFAHQLDQEDGEADGAPRQRSRERHEAWRRVFNMEFARLQDQVEQGRHTVMDEYGATDPAEFFAVATECFFEKPRQLQKRRPALYEELKIFYGQDPIRYH